MVGIVGVIGDKMVLNSTPLGGTLILSVLMMPSGIADARDASPAENNILQLSAAMAMPCASGKLSYRQASNLSNSGKSAVSQSSLGVARGRSGGSSKDWVFGTASRCGEKAGVEIDTGLELQAARNFRLSLGRLSLCHDDGNLVQRTGSVRLRTQSQGGGRMVARVCLPAR